MTQEDAAELITTLLSLEGNDRILDDMVEGARASGLHAAVQAHDTSALYDWLMGLLSLQGISDQIAWGYIKKWGNATYADLERRLGTTRCACPKLGGFANYTGCGYRKGQGTCARPQHLRLCPVRQLPLRKGLLNVQAVSLFYWLSDRCEGDLVAMIDRTIAEAKAAAKVGLGVLVTQDNSPSLDQSHQATTGAENATAAKASVIGEPGRVSTGPPDWVQAAKSALIADFSSVDGVSAKLANMCLADLMIGGRLDYPDWRAVASQMVAVDSLVHNHLERTGVLTAFEVEHKYGPACYGLAGCETVIHTITNLVRARTSAAQPDLARPNWPTPLEVQKAIWRFCTEGALDTCNAARVGQGPGCNFADSCPVRVICRQGLRTS